MDYATGGEILERYKRAWETFNGDEWVALFTEDAEYHDDPFGTALVGHNELRAYLMDAAESQRHVEFTVERHWISGDTLLAAWHASFIRRASGRYVRLAGFLVADVASDGRIGRFREWSSYGPEGRG